MSGGMIARGMAGVASAAAALVVGGWLGSFVPHGQGEHPGGEEEQVQHQLEPLVAAQHHLLLGWQASDRHTEVSPVGHGGPLDAASLMQEHDGSGGRG